MLLENLLSKENGVDNLELIEVNEAIRNHPVEDSWRTFKSFNDSNESIKSVNKKSVY